MDPHAIYNRLRSNIARDHRARSALSKKPNPEGIFSCKVLCEEQVWTLCILCLILPFGFSSAFAWECGCSPTSG